MQELTPQRRLGEFILHERLGEGGVGVVYRAVQTTLGREAVIKVLRPPHRARQDLGERFAREAQLASRLEHPYAAHVYAFGAEPDGLLWIAMEHVRGTALSDFLRMHGPWSLDRLVPFFEKVCEAVQTAHDQGIIHRDLKPSNVMVLARAGQLLPKLLDFGVAKWVEPRPLPALDVPAPDAPRPEPPAAAPTPGPIEDGDADREPAASWSARTVPLSDASPPPGRPGALVDTGASTHIDLTMTGVVLGSPAYMAPEQWTDPAAAGAAADQYALGVLLYETLSGRLPFVGNSFEEMQHLHCEVEAAPLGDGVPAAVARVVRRALAKKAGERFASVLELGAALRVAAQGSPPAPLPAALAVPVEGNPYRGLSAFEAEHSALFFGREREAREVTARLRRDPLLIVAGDSGVGKSSLCRAGVLPSIERGGLGDGRRWQAVTLQPGLRPATALAAAVAGFAGDGPGGMDEAIARVARRVRRDGERAPDGFLLLVDQLEEMVTLGEPDEAARFAAALLDLCALPGGVRVLAAVRGDFATRVLARLGGGAEIARTLYVLGPLDDEGIRAAITGPARAMGYAFESDEMVDALVRQASGLDGALPLLQFALAELWELRDPERKTIPAAALERVGGLTGIVARHADDLLQRLRPVQRTAARRILLRLVTAERTRARRRAAELLPAGAGDDDRAGLEALIRGRIVVARDDEAGATYELAHEVLISRWGSLAGWLHADADRHAAEERLRAAAGEWERMGRAREALYGQAQLAEAAVLDEPELDGGAAAFLRASRRAVRRRRVAWRAGLAAAFLLLAAVAAALVVLNREAELQNQEARRHIVALYVEEGRRAVLDGYRQRALVYLAEAWRRGGRSPALRFLLERAGTALDDEGARLSGHRDWVRDARFSPDGSRVATASDDHTARIWDARSGALLHELRGHRGEVRAIAFSPDGAAVVTASWDGSARLWEIASGRPLWTVDLRAGRPAAPSLAEKTEYLSLPCAADISPDGRRVLAGCLDDRVAIISRDGAVEGWLSGARGPVSSATFSADGTRVLLVAEEGPPRLHDLASGEQIELGGDAGGVRRAAFSRDGSRVITVGRDDTARVWSQSGQLLSTLRGHQGPIIAAELSPDGSRAVTTGVDRTLRIWDAADGHLITAARLHEAPPGALAISPDGTRIFTGDQAGIGVLSDGDGRRLATYEGHRYTVWSAHFSADGSRVVTAGGDGTARVWRVGGDRIEELRGHTGAVTGVRFAPDGVLLSASEDGTIRRWPGGDVFARAGAPLWALELDPDGRLVAAGAVDGSVRIWRLADRRLLHTLAAHQGTVYALAFDRDGRRLATTGADGAVRVWDAARGVRLAELPGGSRKEYAVGFTSEGLLASAGIGGEIRLRDPATGAAIRTLRHDGEVSQLLACGDRLLAAAGSAIRVWRADGTAGSVIAGSGESILAASCQEDRVATGGAHEIAVAELAGGTVLDRVELPGDEVLAIDSAPDGRIAAGTLAGTVTMVRLALDRRPPDELARRARAELPLVLGERGVVLLRK